MEHRSILGLSLSLSLSLLSLLYLLYPFCPSPRSRLRSTSRQPFGFEQRCRHR